MKSEEQNRFYIPEHGSNLPGGLRPGVNACRATPKTETTTTTTATTTTVTKTKTTTITTKTKTKTSMA